VSRVRYELFMSLRYLRARRLEAFISLITLISIVGVPEHLRASRVSPLTRVS